MKQKGFTLVEMLGAIIILSLIVLVAYPSIISVVKRSDEEIDSATKALIVSAAKNYYDDNEDTCPTIQELISKGYLISSLKKGSTGENIDTNKHVDINNNYNIVDSCN